MIGKNGILRKNYILTILKEKQSIDVNMCR